MNQSLVEMHRCYQRKEMATLLKEVKLINNGL